MFCSAAPFKTTLPVIVPPLVNASVTFIVPLFVTVTPDNTVKDATVTVPTLLGALGVPDGMDTESILLGTKAGFQLLAVFQSVLVVPVHVTKGVLSTVIVYVLMVVPSSAVT